MSSTNWTTVTESSFPHEREALEFIRARFPGTDKYRAWSNFEFIADDGSVNEVDLFVLTPMGIFLIEIKSRPGTITGDAGTWTWEHEGRRYSDDNPLLLANRKVKKLKSLLDRQKAIKKLKGPLPFIEALVFCSAEDQQNRLSENGRTNVFLRDVDGTDGNKARPGILAAVMRREGLGHSGRADRPVVKAVSQAMSTAGIRESQRSRKVSDFVLNKLIMEGPHFQDWEATHVKSDEVKRRIRIYSVRPGATKEDREITERAALREFRLLETLQHSSILRTHGFTEHELGPALILEHYPKCLRLDHFLAQKGERLKPEVRLDLLRQIADVIRFAHDKRVIHRGLSPQSILVVDIDSDRPKIKVFNWQVGYRVAGSSGSSGVSVSATRHINQLVEDISTAYIAPEALINSEEQSGEHLDIFSLGTIAYHLFAGQPPASNDVELCQKLRETDGLQISSVCNGAGECLQYLIQFATHPNVADRTENVREFLEQLDEVQSELLDFEHDVVDDPAAAQAGDTLPGGYLVKKVLGSGACAKALLVEYEDQEAVLKVALSPDHNDRLRDEGEILEKLHQHQYIVKFYRTIEIGGHVCLLMSRAGHETLGDRLVKQRRLHVGLLQRFGDDLLQVVAHLEEQGIPHRDIKPHNIGVGKVGRGDKLHLVLFDFSLSRTSPDNIHAGTIGYLDPFLAERKPPRWDLHAERYAAAVTLFECATGTLPRWGEGDNPLATNSEVSIDSEAFDSSVRDKLNDFFSRALRRDPKQRFDNADVMIQEWRDCFKDVQARALTEDANWDEVVKLLDVATLDTPISELGLSSVAIDALDRKNILGVRALLARKPGRLKRMSGITGDVRQEIRKVAEYLRDRLGAQAELVIDKAPLSDVEVHPSGICSVDVLFERISRGNPRASDNTEQEFLQSYLGLDEQIETTWPSQAELASQLAAARGDISQWVTTAHGRWRREPLVTKLRQDIVEMVGRDGGVMSAAEIAVAVLLTRGSVEEEPQRTRQAMAVTRAAIETELIMATPKLTLRREHGRIILAESPDLADYAVRLGEQADELAAEDPLVPPARTLQQLRSIRPPATARPLSDSRLLRLAAVASQHAAVSSRQELYPCGMDAERALRLSQGALLGTGQLRIEELKRRVAGRYPEAAPLPDRPELDELLNRVAVGFTWDQTIAPRGAYRSPSRDPLASSHPTSELTRRTTDLGEPTGEVSPQDAEARQFDERLGRAKADGTFIAMTVEPRGYVRAVEELCQRYGVKAIDVEAAFVNGLREVAAEKKVKWERVLQADAKPGSEDWSRLLKIVRQAAPNIEAAITANDQTVLLIYPSLLSRYGQMDMLTKLREQVGRPGGLPGLWMLIAGDSQTELPVMDGEPIPVIGPAEWARIPEAWLRNRHRSNGSESHAKAQSSQKEEELTNTNFAP